MGGFSEDFQGRHEELWAQDVNFINTRARDEWGPILKGISMIYAWNTVWSGAT